MSLPRLLLSVAALLACSFPSAAFPPAPNTNARLPVGLWTIEFANAVTEKCEVKQDGTASVVEPNRSSAGKATAKNGVAVLTFDDDRVERWTPVGERMVVEHWFPSSQFPSGTPVLGIATLSKPAGNGSVQVFPDTQIASLKKKIGPKGPTFLFKLYSVWSYSNFYYRIEVCDKNGRVLQSEEFRNGGMLAMDDPDALRIIDVNGDGYRDIQVLGGRDQGKAWYKRWLYDPAKNRFVWSDKVEIPSSSR